MKNQVKKIDIEKIKNCFYDFRDETGFYHALKNDKNFERFKEFIDTLWGNISLKDVIEGLKTRSLSKTKVVREFNKRLNEKYGITLFHFND